MQDKVLETVGDPDLKVYAVWEPILRTDNEAASRRATHLLPDPRVEHYWVPTRDLGKAFQKPIDLRTEPAWDVYLLYAPGVRWEAEPPRPDDFMHQLGGRLPGEKDLDGEVLAERVKRTLAGSPP